MQAAYSRPAPELFHPKKCQSQDIARPDMRSYHLHINLFPLQWYVRSYSMINLTTRRKSRKQKTKYTNTKPIKYFLKLVVIVFNTR